jgi:hypothetical protein
MTRDRAPSPAGELASFRNGEYLFKRREPSYEVEVDLFRKTKHQPPMIDAVPQ